MADTTRHIKLPIIANGRYCNNDCPLMMPDAKSCKMFGELTWHYKKKFNGNIRPSACRKAEIKDGVGGPQAGKS